MINTHNISYLFRFITKKICKNKNIKIKLFLSHFTDKTGYNFNTLIIQSGIE